MTLTITIIETNDCPKRGGSFFSKTDQYLTISVGTTRKVTTCKKNAGREAKFNEKFTFDYNGESVAVFDLYDLQRFSADELLGSGKLALRQAPLMPAGQWTGPVHLINQSGKRRGTVFVTVTLAPNSETISNMISPTNKSVLLDDLDSLSESDLFQDLPSPKDDDYTAWRKERSEAFLSVVETGTRVRDGSSSLAMDSSSILDSAVLRDVAALTGDVPIGPNRDDILNRLPSDQSWAAGI